MRMITLQRILVALLLCISCNLLYPQASPAPAATETSCRQFVQQFYDWYLPRTQRWKGRPADLVLKEKPSVLSPELAKGLKEDSAAQSKSDDIVGLDFDPFLNSQDDGFEKCVAVKTVVQGTGCHVDVSCKFPKQRSEQPFTPKLQFAAGQWVFVNLHYTVDGKAYDLLTMLKELAEDRKPKSK